MPGHRWKKGESGNPAGPQVKYDLKADIELTKKEVTKTFKRLMMYDLAALENILKNTKATRLEAFVAKILQIGINKGDPARLTFLLDRIIGKVSDKVDVVVKPYVMERLDGPDQVLGSDTIEGEYMDVPVVEETRRVRGEAVDEAVDEAVE